MSEKHPFDCPDCGDGLSRRDFVRRVTGAAVAGGLLPFATGTRLFAGNPIPNPSTPPETAVKRFYDSMTDAQKKVICFPFDHPLRSKINANWAITEPTIAPMMVPAS